MRIANAVFILTIFFSPSVSCALQTPVKAAPVPAAAPAPPAPSALLRPSLDTVQQTVTGLKLEKWKRGTVREEADANVGTVVRDLEDTLPPLLHEADAAPGTLSKMLPVSRNIDALYDVLLRIVEAARVSAPAAQITELQEALVGLEKARNALDERLQEAAATQDKQIKDLRTTVQAQAAIKCPAAAPAPVCPAPTPAKTVKKKPRKPLATTPPATPAPATTAPAAPKQ